MKSRTLDDITSECLLRNVNAILEESGHGCDQDAHRCTEALQRKLGNPLTVLEQVNTRAKRARTKRDAFVQAASKLRVILASAERIKTEAEKWYSERPAYFLDKLMSVIARRNHADASMGIRGFWRAGHAAGNWQYNRLNPERWIVPCSAHEFESIAKEIGVPRILIDRLYKNCMTNHMAAYRRASIRAISAMIQPYNRVSIASARDEKEALQAWNIHVHPNGDGLFVSVNEPRFNLDCRYITDYFLDSLNVKFYYGGIDQRENRVVFIRNIRHIRTAIERIQRKKEEDRARQQKQEMEAEAHRETATQQAMPVMVEAILSLFPNLSRESALGIAEHACGYNHKQIFGRSEYCARVGLSSNLCIKDRAFAAVWAHLRHNHTNYEYILRDLWGGDEDEPYEGLSREEREEFAQERRDRARENKRIARGKIRETMDNLVKDLGCTYHPTIDIDGYYTEIAA